MAWKFEKEFRLSHPETIGETDSHYDLDNYKDWLENQLEQIRTVRVLSLDEYIEKFYSNMHWDKNSARSLAEDFAQYRISNLTVD